jgi:cold-inducible RNA-binding protein
MSKKLYVGGIAYATTEDSLRSHFSQAGTVESVSIIMDKMTNPPRSKGFGFVQMASDAEADNAINMFNGKPLDGRNLTVNEARPMEPRPPRKNFGGDNRGNW